MAGLPVGYIEEGFPNLITPDLVAFLKIRLLRPKSRVSYIFQYKPKKNQKNPLKNQKNPSLSIGLKLPNLTANPLLLCVLTGNHLTV